MTYPKEFENVGKEPGLQIWRVEKMEMKPVPLELYGEFFRGDSYVVINTSDGPAYSVHSWIGSKSSIDERGSTPFFMVQLDSYLDGKAVLFTEFENDETTKFLSLFPDGIKYRDGGIASGFKHVVEEKIKRVLHMKGRHHIRAKEVDFAWSSFNSGDCFLIDLGETIYHWAGEKCNPFERLMTSRLAIELRDHERAGSAEIIFVDEGDEPEEIIKLLGPKPELPEKTNDDHVADAKSKNAASLYQISDAAGDMKTTLVADKNPFKQAMMSDKDCFILDNSANKIIYVWKGKEANIAERKAAFDAAQKFIKEKKYSENTKIAIMSSGAEDGMFKHFFFNWVDKYESTTLTRPDLPSRIAKIEKIPFDASALHDNTKMAAQHGMVDDGSGKFQIWRVEKGEKVLVDPSSHGQFYGGDCYLVSYSYTEECGTKHIIYFWQGQKSSQDERGASAILAMGLDDSMGGVATQVRVTQGKEPPHLVSLFKDKPLIIYLGGTSRKGGDTEPASTRLFHIRRSSNARPWAIEVAAKAESLNTNDVFVLKKPAPKPLFVWKGKGATAEELKAAKYVTELLGGAVTELMEGKEEDAFWKALGGKMPYQTSPSLQNTANVPRLFACSNATGNLIAEEVPGVFSQMDLATDDVMILDCTEQLFIWIGKDANEAEKTGTAKIAQDYLDSDPSGRSGIPITTIKQGEEPPTFTGWFHAWDPKMWNMSVLETMQQLVQKK